MRAVRMKNLWKPLGISLVLGACSEGNVEYQSLRGQNLSTESVTERDAGEETTEGLGLAESGLCDARASISSYEFIDSVAFGESALDRVKSGNSRGYYFEKNSVVVGQTFTIKLTPGYPGARYRESWRVWVDINRNGQFEATEKMAEISGVGEQTVSIVLPSTLATDPINHAIRGWVPGETLIGDVRVRVAMRYGAFPSACGNFTYGEVEDFTAYVARPNHNPRNLSDIDGNRCISPADKRAFDSAFSLNQMLQPIPPSIFADANNDGQVSGTDLIDHRAAMKDGSLHCTGKTKWQNGDIAEDVDGNGKVEQADAQIIIDDINLNGQRALPAVRTENNFLDVNGDGFVSSIDVLIVSNKLASIQGEAAAHNGKTKWQNGNIAEDVNQDGKVGQVDCQIIIDDINAKGSRALPALRPAGAYFLDVNGDGFVSPIDALIVSNKINSAK